MFFCFFDKIEKTKKIQGLPLVEKIIKENKLGKIKRIKELLYCSIYCLILYTYGFSLARVLYILLFTTSTTKTL